MPELIPVLRKDDIKKKVGAIARQISRDYHNSEPVIIGVLKGSFIFLSDLIRQLSIPVTIEFVGISSYGSGSSSTGSIQLTYEIETDLANKDVLIVEDIVDTGLTLVHLIEYLKSKGPKSVRFCTFIDKRERREVEAEIDYACHVVDTGFIVGYGLDYAGKYRNLPDLYHLKF